jgi:heavy metal translocating P-type ATPase
MNRFALSDEASIKKAMKEYRFRVANMDCDNDASRLRRSLESQPGLELLEIFASSGTVRLTVDEEALSQENVEAKLSEFGFPVKKQGEQVGFPSFWKNPKVLAAIVSGFVLVLGWLLSYWIDGWLPFVLYTTSILIGGYYFGREALEELFFERRIGIELLMTVAAAAAYALGQPAEAAMLVFLYSISEALEGYTEAKTRSAVRALMDLTPRTALLIEDGEQREIPVEDLRPGDRFLVHPGQSVPTDGEIVSGASSLDQAPVTGESVPVEKGVGDTVYAGSINAEGSLEVKATKVFAENTISRIIVMVEEAQERKGESQRFIERFGNWYSPAVLLIGIAIALLPPMFFDTTWYPWAIRATIFIVAAAPCALVISIPITLVAALGTAARHGVLIKGGVYIERLAEINVVALDKTGTITLGEPSVTDCEFAEHAATPSREVVLAITAGIERLSQHPLAKAIVRFTETENIEPRSTTDFNSLTGAGASASVDGQLIYIGKPKLFEDELQVDLGSLSAVVTRLQDEGKTVAVVGTDKQVWAAIAMRDTVRDNAKHAIAGLHDIGIKKVAMLTGDNERTAAQISKEVGIDDFYASLKPDDKVTKLRELMQQYKHVAMVGDGVNDAPALAEASVGIAMGAAGTDVALETADVALMADDLEKLVYAFRLAKRNQTIVRQNLILSAIVILILVIGAVSGQFTLPVAVLGHEISEFIVVANGLRMLTFGTAQS